MSRTDLKPLLLILGAALLGAAWAIYNRSLTGYPYSEAELRPLVWVIFATPAATLLGWWAARWQERWWAVFTCFCIYYFTPFIAARYESCSVVRGGFSLASCFVDTERAQTLANDSGHAIYFQAIVIIQLLAAIAVALHRSRRRSTIQ